MDGATDGVWMGIHAAALKRGVSWTWVFRRVRRGAIRARKECRAGPNRGQGGYPWRWQVYWPDVAAERVIAPRERRARTAQWSGPVTDDTWRRFCAVLDSLEIHQAMDFLVAPGRGNSRGQRQRAGVCVRCMSPTSRSSNPSVLSSA